MFPHDFLLRLVLENVLSEQRLCFVFENVLYVPKNVVENVLVDLNGIASAMNIVSVL